MSEPIRLDRELLPPGSRVLCAVSGGADSVCLLSLLRELGDVECLCAHYDHGIRPDAGEDAAFVAELCRRWGVPFFTERGDVPARARETGESLETAGREMRYAFLRRTAREQGADRIATAHTLGDNAETVLFRMARGTGLRGLGGIPPRRGMLVRPLLDVSRERIEAHLRDRGIPWREDETNAGDAAARNRVRHHVLPALEQVHPGAAENIARMTASLREDEAFLSALAAERLEAWGGEPSAAGLRALPRSLSLRVIRLWLGGDVSRERCEAVLELCGAGPSARADLPGRTVRREYDRLRIGEPETAALPERELRPGETLILPETGTAVRCRVCAPGEEIQSSFNTFSFSYVNIYDKLTVGCRRDGDRIALVGRDGTRRVKDLLMERKIPRHLRETVPVLRRGETLLAVGGFGQGRDTLPGPGEPFLRVTLEKIREETQKE